MTGLILIIIGLWMSWALCWVKLGLESERVDPFLAMFIAIVFPLLVIPFLLIGIIPL